MFNRPFDNQDNIRVRLETESKLHIQELIKNGELDLVWSYILAYENSQNPFFERRFAIEKWQKLATVLIGENQEIKTYAKILMEQNIKIKDALHIACAVNAQAEYFLSTDNKLLNKMQANNDIIALNPIDFIQEIK
ncbi:hypothetical protein [Moraxella nasicaprae]|uniref:PIN domain-containing protein n=1 Tax=Moraxella nasicaprae TaxID=2904122 RepID=A0ABY6F5R9_9GAMM|nr:hypothetical protein [Moraxella nasicaprae]UXZ05225.1 hypothetical protein LU297_01870 [Moraxella nasicaprae]